MRPSVPRMTKIIWDDFLPRFEYPESMKKLDEYMKKVKESGLKYGEYVEQHPDEPRKPIAEDEKKPFTRNCRKCGKKFAPPLLADGYTVSRQVNCNDCLNEQREKRGLPKIGEETIICRRCGKEVKAHNRNQRYCEECKHEVYLEKLKKQRELWSNGKRRKG